MRNEFINDEGVMWRGMNRKISTKSPIVFKYRPDIDLQVTFNTPRNISKARSTSLDGVKLTNKKS